MCFRVNGTYALKPHEAHLIIPDAFADINMHKPRTPVSFD